jgi:hypothetical protein
MAPPTRSALLLHAERRLRDKLAQAERTIGRGLDVLPVLSVGTRAAAHCSAPEPRDAGSPLAVAELRGEIHRILTHWRRQPRTVIPSERSEPRDLHFAEPVIAATRSTARGWIALLDEGRLVASSRDGPDDQATEDIESLLQAFRHADGAARSADDLEARPALRRLEQWIAHDWARRSCAVAPHASPLRQRVLRRIECASGVVARHQRRQALSHAASLRAALEGRLTLGMERAHDYLPYDQDGARWLARAAALLPAPSDPATPHEHAARAARVRAIILFGTT